MMVEGITGASETGPGASDGGANVQANKPATANLH